MVGGREGIKLCFMMICTRSWGGWVGLLETEYKGIIKDQIWLGLKVIDSN
jgi:hypothetical protein